MMQCAYPRCRQEGAAVTYYDRPLCEKHWKMAVSDDERVAAATKARLGLAYRPTAHGWEIVVADHEPSVVECACGALVVPSKRGCPVCKVTADANLQIPT